MANVFFRTSIAPYRVDTYNALHRILDCRMYFMDASDDSQDFDQDRIMSRCEFVPTILAKKKVFGLTYFKDIWKILRENDPDIVIVPEFKPLSIQVIAYKLLRKRKMKVISMCDDSYEMVAGRKDFTLTHTLARKAVTPLVDDLLLVDDKVSRWYADRYGKGTWMPIIRDEKRELDLYRHALTLSREYESRFGLSGKRVLLYVGRLVEVKNLPCLIEAVRLSEGSFTTVIIGDGPLKEDLERQAALTGKEIIFAGRYDDDEIRAWFNIGDIFVLPSTTEPFGAVTNEALLAGCYCLLSSACGSTCLIDSSNGRIFDPRDPGKLAELIDSSFAALPPKETRTGNRMNLTFEQAVEKVIKQLKD